jgi:hypothetical protein
MRRSVPVLLAILAIGGVTWAQAQTASSWGFEKRINWLILRISHANRQNAISHAEYVRDMAKAKAIRKEVYGWDESQRGKLSPQEMERIYGEINTVDDGIKWLKPPTDHRPF